jgi:hypothetical protein
MTIAITNLSAIRTPGSISPREINTRGVRIAAGLHRLNRADAVEVLRFARGLVLEYNEGEAPDEDHAGAILGLTVSAISGAIIGFLIGFLS